MEIAFSKYHGSGNDFILIDNRDQIINKFHETQFTNWCRRRFGVGADGLILLSDSPDLDFHMTYFNSDGRESSMCGNGGRCVLKYAMELGIVDRKARFSAIDGLHEAQMTDKQWVSLKMTDVPQLNLHNRDYILDTGSPHYVMFLVQQDEPDLISRARAIRYSPAFERDGINVNFVWARGNGLRVRTYERGVEDETLSCGTGVTASALAYHLYQQQEEGRFVQSIQTPGGELRVRYKYREGQFEDIWLEGPATFVYRGFLSA